MSAVTDHKTCLARAFEPTGGWKRRVTVMLGALALAGIALAETKPDPAGLKAHPITVDARPIAAFDKSNPSVHRFGRLEWLGGVVLTSASRHFGGWSGLALDPDGRGFLAVSDAGTWMSGRIAYRGARLAGLEEVRIGPLLAKSGKPLANARDRDAEGVALLDGTPGKGKLLVSFEGHDRIGRFPISSGGLGAPEIYLPIPDEVKKERSYDGLEAIAVLKGGSMKGAVVGFAENPLGKDTQHAGWLWLGGSPKRLSMTNIGGFSLTDAASLADGSLVVLERRFRWNEGVRMRMRLVRAGDIKPGALLSGEVLIEADLNQEIDNMEGLAVHTGVNDETVLTLISDDNFNPLLQRTLLLQFALPAPARSAENP